MNINIDSNTETNVSHQLINGVTITIENRTKALVEAIFIEEDWARTIAETLQKPYRNLVALRLNDCYLLEASQINMPEDPGLTYFFPETYHFVITGKDSLIKIRAIKNEHQDKKVYLKKHPDFQAYVTTKYPPKPIDVDKVAKMAIATLNQASLDGETIIQYNEYGSILLGTENGKIISFWAQNGENQMKLIPEEHVDLFYNMIKISTKGMGYFSRETRDTINHFPAKTLTISDVRCEGSEPLHS